LEALWEVFTLLGSERFSRQVRVLVPLLVCFVVLMATACGSDTSPTSAPGNAATTAEASAASGAVTKTADASPAASGEGVATPSKSSSDVTLTLYSGQHEDLTKALASGFEAVSGIKVDVRAGSDADLANQIIEEGDRSKADIFMSEEPDQAAALGEKGLFAPVDPATLAMTDPRLNPKNGTWLAYAARSRAIFYNPKLIAEQDLPKSIFDLTNPEWKGKFAYAPSGAFVSTVTYLINTVGEEKTLEWLKGIKANGENLQKNGTIRDSVEAGQIGFGLSNHYYWYILAESKGGPDKMTSKVHFMSSGDPGALVLSSGVGILKSSKHRAEAQKFLAWLADPDGGQKVIATTTPQYPTAPGVTSTMGLTPLSELQPPSFDQGSLGDVSKAKELITKAGII
jgi:iron(III) transport system substrate-binding protein